jgi:hypothetical protein
MGKTLASGTVLSPYELLTCSADYTAPDSMPWLTELDARDPSQTQADGCSGGFLYEMMEWLKQHGAATCTGACTSGCLPYPSIHCNTHEIDCLTNFYNGFSEELWHGHYSSTTQRSTVND